MQTGASAALSELAVFDEEQGGDYDPVLYLPAASVITERMVSDALTAEAHRDFAEHGWLSVKSVMTAGEVSDAKASIDDLTSGRFQELKGIMIERSAEAEFKSLSADERFDCVRKLWDFCRFDARMDRVAHGANVRAILKNLFSGQETRMFQDMALLKPPGRGREKPWHQDHAFFDFPLGTQIVGVWIALDPATVENGCMHLLDSGHKLGPRNHFRRRDWQICDTEMKIAEPVAFPLGPGDALFFDGLIPHGTPANTSRERRRAIQFHYCCASAMPDEKDSRLKIFGGEGKGSTC